MELVNREQEGTGPKGVHPWGRGGTDAEGQQFRGHLALPTPTVYTGGSLSSGRKSHIRDDNLGLAGDRADRMAGAHLARAQ